MRLSLDGSTFVLAAILLLTLPLPWLLAAVIAAGFHELCHILALYLAGARPQGIHIGTSGAAICTPALSPGTELICAAAGPLGSLLLLFFLPCIPRIAVCAGVQGLFNLLPVYPLDGGRILHSGTAILFPRHAETLVPILESIALFCLILFALFLSIRYSLGLVPILTAVALTVKAFLRKIPCKESKLAVQ